jgi:tetratricopeptide (TPR) repeat protein
MEAKAMEIAQGLSELLTEDLLAELPNLADYLESYTALDVHILVRFGRWKQILNDLQMPQDPSLMLFRTATIYAARALSYAMLEDGSNGYLKLAKLEADQLDEFRQCHADALQNRILHNNTVADLLAVDAVMVRGELAYRSDQHEDGIQLLREAVQLQDDLNFDEPWGKMQPVRHALGGLLLEQGQLEEAEAVFRKDLHFHPRNPWALVGLIQCLQKRASIASSSCCDGHDNDDLEIPKLQEELRQQRLMQWADFDVVVACECCAHPAG